LRIAFLLALIGPPRAVACVEGPLKGAAVTLEREISTAPAGEPTAILVLGGGFFHAASVVKRGGSDDSTRVTIELDGEPVFSNSFATLKNPWMQIGSASLLAQVRSEGDASTLTVWYSPELKFRQVMIVRIAAGEEGVQSLRLRAVYNRPAPHEHAAGQPAAPGMPRFN
jgi:hypothetical protein